MVALNLLAEHQSVEDARKKAVALAKGWADTIQLASGHDGPYLFAAGDLGYLSLRRLPDIGEAFSDWQYDWFDTVHLLT